MSRTAASVGVVIPTRGDRPAQLRAAVEAALTQDYTGQVSVVVVVDGGHLHTVADDLHPVVGGGVRRSAEGARSAMDGGGPHSAGDDGVRRPVGGGGAPRPAVRVLPNRFTPGLPGARNTGIAACDTDLIAFCDDDDLWLPGKLAAQTRLLADGGAEFASCGIEIEYGGRRVPRPAGTDRVTAADLVRSRMVMVHSSTFLFRRGTLWVDESAPRGQNEDWDLALRAAKRHPIANADEPLVRVRWGASHYVARWADRIAGLEWMLARHPELAVDPRGAARIYGQLAFGHAALGNRRGAARWAVRTLAARFGEPRAPIALAVAAGLIPAATVLALLHHRGRGI